MKPVIALYTMSCLSILAIWNCFSVWKSINKCNGKKELVRLSSELSNSIIGTVVVCIITILSWVL